MDVASDRNESHQARLILRKKDTNRGQTIDSDSPVSNGERLMTLMKEGDAVTRRNEDGGLRETEGDESSKYEL